MKMNTVTNNQLIGEIVAADYRTASVFKKHQIDFCCQGGRTLDRACREASLNPETLLNELNETIQRSQPNNVAFQTWNESFLADYIEQNHHAFVRQTIGEIQSYLAKICSVHGDRHPELFEIKSLFAESAEDLLAHMEDEEKMLFPYVKKLHQLLISGESISRSQLPGKEYSLRQMQEEHDQEGERFRKMAALSSNYSVPADGCNTYSVAMKLLKAFEDDLHLHIHLENNILFPKLKALEEKLFSQ